jgi:hypothetical protein
LTRVQRVTRQEWRHKVLPEYRGQAQETVAQLRALGIQVELRHGDWLVFDLEAEIDQRGVEMLDRVWPRWRDCVSE